MRQIRVDLFNRSPEPRENHAFASTHCESNEALLRHHILRCCPHDHTCGFLSEKVFCNSVIGSIIAVREILAIFAGPRVELYCSAIPLPEASKW